MWDLYHIEFERSENKSNLPQGKYIEPSIARHIALFRCHPERDDRLVRTFFYLKIPDFLGRSFLICYNSLGREKEVKFI